MGEEFSQFGRGINFRKVEDDPYFNLNPFKVNGHIRNEDLKSLNFEANPQREGIAIFYNLLAYVLPLLVAQDFGQFQELFLDDGVDGAPSEAEVLQHPQHKVVLLPPPVS